MNSTQVLAYIPSPPQGVWQLGPVSIRAYALCIVAGILLALDVHGDVAHVAVLQAAMPTAVVSAIIAGDAGCDARLASAATVTNTLLALATLPLLAACLPALGL